MTTTPSAATTAPINGYIDNAHWNRPVPRPIGSAAAIVIVYNPVNDHACSGDELNNVLP
jgi:hypothetical protein